MNMIIGWDYQCQFLFSSWQATTKGGFALGCIITFIFCVLSVGYINLKQYLLTNIITDLKKRRAFKIFSYMVQTLNKFLVMFLMMTMNGYVNLVIILAMPIGYVIFRLNKEQQLKRQ